MFSELGICSRRQAEQYIKEGRVWVNGTPAKLGDSADMDSDLITFDGVKVERASRTNLYIMLNKPKGYVCTLSDEQGRKTIVDLLSGLSARVYPVGRLDMYSEGMLLLTNDGALTNRLTHPRYHIGKQYILEVDVSGALEPDIEPSAALSRPFTIDGYRTSPGRCKPLSCDGVKWSLLIEIYEGRNRQLRKMCEACGYKVLNLKRVGIGELRLGELKLGKWRYLHEEEIGYLMSVK